MSKLTTKWIGDNQVIGAKIRLQNDETLRARNAAGTADIDILKVSTSDTLQILREVDMVNAKITNLADPTNPKDAVTKQFLENFLAGFTDQKDSVRVTSVGALPTATYDNGTAGVGATLTADANGAIPNIDGIGLSANDRILVKNQIAGFENGIYVVTDVGSAGTPWVLTRATDADGSSSNASVTQGVVTTAVEGTSNGNQTFLLTTSDPITLGTTALSFVKIGENVTDGLGLNKVGSTLSVDIGAGLAFSGNAVTVAFHLPDLIDGTTKAGGSGEVVSRISKKQTFTLSGTDLTNGYVDLDFVANRDSIRLTPKDGILQEETVDYNVSYLGGTSGKTRITFAGALAVGGGCAIEVGEKWLVEYTTIDF